MRGSSVILARAQPKVGGAPLTRRRRADIERHARVGGGISRSEAAMLLDDIDRLVDALAAVIDYGREWDDRQWTTWLDAVVPLVDDRA